MLRALAIMITSLVAAPAGPALPMVDVPANLAPLPASERAALKELVGAAAVMDQLFMRQVWAGNATLALTLAADPSATGRQRLQQLRDEKGPWLRRQHDQPFVPGVGAKPLVGSFYPAGSTRQEIEAWLRGLDADAHGAATSPVTTLRRSPAGGFVVVPYSREYQPELALAAGHLTRAAALTGSASLRGFLEQRAASFQSNDYHGSDLAWMKLDAALEPTIGPYEIYEDGWFNAKADFQAVIALRHPAETAKLARVRAKLQDLEDHLPLAPALRSADVLGRKGAQAPLRIVDVILASGDVHRALAAGSFVLPNDQRITSQLGSKRTLMRNVHQARWRALLLPLAQRLLAPPDRARPSFDAFFTHLVMHELMHLLGPRELKRGAQRTSVSERLQETHAPIEEAKADVTAVLSMRHLIDKGVLPRSLGPALDSSFLSALLHAVRAGTGDPRGQAAALVLGTLLAEGAVRLGEAGFAVQPSMTTTLRTLGAQLLALQAAGDRGQAALLLETRAVLQPEVRRALERGSGVPRDVALRFVTGEALVRELHAR